MSYQPIYTPMALMEYKDAVSWYAVRSKQAAENFVKAVRERITLICEKPCAIATAIKILGKHHSKNIRFTLSILPMKARKP